MHVSGAVMLEMLGKICAETGESLIDVPGSF